MEGDQRGFIKTINGMVRWEHGMLECMMNVNGHSFQTIIHEDNREGCLPGDVVEAYILPVSQWKTNDGEDLTHLKPMEFKQFFNDHVVQALLRNFTEVYSTDDIVALIMERKQTGLKIVPTIGIYNITTKKKYNNVSGFIMFGYFIPDDIKLCQVMAMNPDTGKIIEQSQGKVIGNIDRETNVFYPTRSVSQSKLLMKNERESLHNRVLEKMKLIERLDYTDLLTMTIDAPTAQRLDDAVTFKIIDQNTIEIGVHGTDFMSMLEPNSRELGNYIRCSSLSKQFKNEHSWSLGKTMDSFAVFITLDVPSRSPIKIRAGPARQVSKGQFTFDSFSQTVCLQQMAETRVHQQMTSEIIQNALELTNSMYQTHLLDNYQRDDCGHGIIAMLGKWFGIVMNRSLVKRYGDEFVIRQMKVESEGCTTTYRSPLRKKHNAFAMRQILASSVGMSLDEMMYYVCGLYDEEEFKAFISHLPANW